jgi:hypothetical protein
MKRKEWVKQAIEKGKKAFKEGFHSAPCLNKEFMDWIPNRSAVDRKSFLLRKAIYLSYAKGWNIENLNAEI